MKRYLVFCGDHYYADGGWADFRGDFDTLEAAKETQNTLVRKRWYGWAQVVDTETRVILSWVDDHMKECEVKFLVEYPDPGFREPDDTRRGQIR